MFPWSQSYRDCNRNTHLSSSAAVLLAAATAATPTTLVDWAGEPNDEDGDEERQSSYDQGHRQQPENHPEDIRQLLLCNHKISRFSEVDHPSSSFGWRTQTKADVRRIPLMATTPPEQRPKSKPTIEQPQRQQQQQQDWSNKAVSGRASPKKTRKTTNDGPRRGWSTWRGHESSSPSTAMQQPQHPYHSYIPACRPQHCSNSTRENVSNNEDGAEEDNNYQEEPDLSTKATCRRAQIPAATSSTTADVAVAPGAEDSCVVPIHGRHAKSQRKRSTSSISSFSTPDDPCHFGTFSIMTPQEQQQQHHLQDPIQPHTSFPENERATNKTRKSLPLKDLQRMPSQEQPHRSPVRPERSMAQRRSNTSGSRSGRFGECCSHPHSHCRPTLEWGDGWYLVQESVDDYNRIAAHVGLDDRLTIDDLYLYRALGLCGGTCCLMQKAWTLQHAYYEQEQSQQPQLLKPDHHESLSQTQPPMTSTTTRTTTTTTTTTAMSNAITTHSTPDFCYWLAGLCWPGPEAYWRACHRDFQHKLLLEEGMTTTQMERG